MPFNPTRARTHLRSGDLPTLFVEELGWDTFRALQPPVEANGLAYTVTSVAEKRTVAVLQVEPPVGSPLPDKPTRGKIHRELRKRHAEHLLVFTGGEASAAQVWLWARRDPGQPLRIREQPFTPGLNEEALAQRLAALHFPLDAEAGITVVDVNAATRAAFDRNADRVTRRFYDRFKDERVAFDASILGIPTDADRGWYASLMLNRLMFVYFVQKKGFLDANPNYLQDKLAQVRVRSGQGKFHSFYRLVLRRLFHEALDTPADQREPGLDALLGDIPYLNGGLFEVHRLEHEHDDALDIPDDAFQRVFAFFDAYHWHLDENLTGRDSRADEINPAVLGHIFEKYVNQKQMGAYYTKEDITDYIGRNTILPALFDAARERDKVAFEPGSALWRRLQEQPDDYIFPAVAKGADHPLPLDIAAGVDDVARRTGWNRPADETHALPTETWREHVARRTRHAEVWDKLVAGDVSSVDDLITLNLDIRRFALDSIQLCEGPDLLRAFWRSLDRITVLDPTCGSGAFLFAALNILEPLYQACLDRMATFVAEADDAGRPKMYPDFRDALADADRHPNVEYAVLKRIILNNLYGVDIMEEAVEICKLRLFLKLVAQVQTADQIEPLPDIDFNIRAGNTLVGFARIVDAQKAIARKLDFDGMGVKVEEQAKQLAAKARLFREQQDAFEGTITPDAKDQLRTRLDALEETLNGYLAQEYGIAKESYPKDFDDRYAAWRASHQPFHWCVDFYEVMEERGGFDVIVGNPPYVEYAGIRSSYQVIGFKSEACGNLYAFVAERSAALCSEAGRVGMIVPISMFCTPRMVPAVRLQLDKFDSSWISHYGWRPAKLFDDVNLRLSIYISSRTSSSQRVYTTRYTKWATEARSGLFPGLHYTQAPSTLTSSVIIPKIGTDVETGLLAKIEQGRIPSDSFVRTNGIPLYYKRTGINHWITVTDYAPAATRACHGEIDAERATLCSIRHAKATKWSPATVSGSRS